MAPQATHLGWFTKYTPFPTQFGHIGNESSNRALGVGDVELEVRRSATQGYGKKSSRKIVLKDVLYAPDYTCNVLGYCVMEDYNVITGPGNEGSRLEDKTGAVVGLLDCSRLFKLWLKGQRKGQSSLDLHGVYWINGRWAETERRRWEAHKAAPPSPKAKVIRHTGYVKRLYKPVESDGKNSLTAAEKAFLKEHYGNEFRFLMQHGLKIYKDEDREEGRRILRALTTEDEPVADGSAHQYAAHVESGPPHPMLTDVPPYTAKEEKWLKDNFHTEAIFLESMYLLPTLEHHRAIGRLHVRAVISGGKDIGYLQEQALFHTTALVAASDLAGEASSEEDVDSETNAFLAELVADPMSHLADHYFSFEQLDWTKQNYGHSGNFLIVHGLKAYNDEDCKDGVALAESFMNEEE